MKERMMRCPKAKECNNYDSYECGNLSPAEMNSETADEWDCYEPVPPEQPAKPTLCEHIEKLVEHGYLFKDDSRYDKEKKDFINIPATYLMSHLTKKNALLEIHYCPTCGAKIGEK